MQIKRWRLKSPPQPLVFRYASLPVLCLALAELAALAPGTEAGASVYRGHYYLEVRCRLRQRLGVLRIAGQLGAYLGPAPVLYAYCAEHGRELCGESARQNS